MRAIRVASAALLGVTALTLAAPAVLAEGGDDSSGNGNITSFGFTVQPQTVAAGGRLQLNAESCGYAAKVSSGVFDTITIPKGQSSATALVDRDAKPGALYEVTFECGSESGHTELTIADGAADAGTTAVPVTAQRGVKAGVGGSAGGVDLRQIGLGVALVGGCAGTAWSHARRRTTDET